MITALSIRAAGALHAASTPPAVPNEAQANPGVWGFVITFLLAVAVMVIIYDMIRRVRRMNYRAQAQQELADEATEAAEADEAAELEALSGQDGTDGADGVDGTAKPPKAAPPTP